MAVALVSFSVTQSLGQDRAGTRTQAPIPLFLGASITSDPPGTAPRSHQFTKRRWVRHSSSSSRCRRLFFFFAHTSVSGAVAEVFRPNTHERGSHTEGYGFLGSLQTQTATRLAANAPFWGGPRPSETTTIPQDGPNNREVLRRTASNQTTRPPNLPSPEKKHEEKW